MVGGIKDETPFGAHLDNSWHALMMGEEKESNATFFGQSCAPSKLGRMDARHTRCA